MQIAIVIVCACVIAVHSFQSRISKCCPEKMQEIKCSSFLLSVFVKIQSCIKAAIH